MESFLNRYRNLTVLAVVVIAQVLLLAWQVRSKEEARLVRVWAVSAVTPLARVIETVRGSTHRFFTDYFVLLDVRDENKHLRAELNRLQMENQFLRTELSTADRARALAAFQERSPSKTIGARIIGNGTGATAKVVFIDRGATAGLASGMAVITPDGIVGKVIGVYPTASQVLLINDPTFAAGVISQKNRVHGTLKGQGHSTCLVDYVENEEKVEQGEWFYTSGDDRVFPKGLPVGQAKVVRQGKTFKEIFIVPSGFRNGLEEVLVIVEGVHSQIPDKAPTAAPVTLLPAPPSPTEPAEQQPQAATSPAPLLTEADRAMERYRRIGEAQRHVYGEGMGAVPNFNVNPAQPPQNPAAPVKPPAGASPVPPAAPGAVIPAPRKPPA
ncbi:MAG: hypothetical protein K2X35_20385 [Bryobacteraceae bacterium]|nr:hypothetical protein [Bryobacteraceae bacterium]